ncbi:MAG: hypothetical protein NZM44_01045 [Candidatus Calescibacterium sp.]|nr:hypothetical protein [Candidatus Calescibacterium sp.]
MAGIVTKDIIEDQGYRYSIEIQEKTVINSFDYNSAKQIANQVREDTIVVSTIDLSIWNELNPSMEKINLDNLNDIDRINFLAFLVFSNKSLRKGFASSFWINLLKLLSNNFFEIYFVYKTINQFLGAYDERININRSFLNLIMNYIEDAYHVEEGFDIYPSKQELNRFLYFLINSSDFDNPYKIFDEVDLLDRIYHKYKILAELSSKDLNNLIIFKNTSVIEKILDIFDNYLGQIVYVTCLKVFPDFNDQSIIQRIRLDDFSSIYPFSLIFTLLDKKVLVIRINEYFFVFEIKSMRSENIENVKSVLKRFGIDFSYLDFIHYSSNEIYSDFIRLIIQLLKSDVRLAYNILSTPFLAYDYEYYNNKGFVSLLVDNFDEARENFLKYLEINPNDLLVNYNLATTYWFNKEYSKAIEIIKKITDINYQKKLFSVVIPVYPFHKKSLIFDVDVKTFLKIVFANLLFLNNEREEAFRLISKISDDKVKHDENLVKFLNECKEFIYENSGSESK